MLDVSGICDNDLQCSNGYVCRYLNILPGTKACVFRPTTRMNTKGKRPGRCPKDSSSAYRPRQPPPHQPPPPPPGPRQPPPPPPPPYKGKRPCNDHSDCPLDKRCCPSSFGKASFCVNPQPVDPQPAITPLIVGVQNFTLDPVQMHCSATLIQSNGLNVLVDPAVHRIVILQNLFEQAGLLIQDIDVVVETHGHPDHYASSELFSDTDHVYNTVTYNGKIFKLNPLSKKEKYFLDAEKNIEISQTPGHTPQDVSVVVRNVPGYGTVSVVGDLITQKDEFFDRFAWNRTLSDENRKKVVCSSNYILPGHSAMFEIDAEQRLKFKCT